MITPLLRLPLATQQDVFAARQRAREVAHALGFDAHDEIRVATAVSEVGRAVAGLNLHADVVMGVADHWPPHLVIEVTSSTALEIEESGPVAEEGLKAGRRLMDSLTIGIAPLVIRMSKALTHSENRLAPSEIRRVRAELARSAVASPFDELRAQNLELITTLDELRNKQEDLERLNQELVETNQGVLAMYSQLSSELEDTNRGVVALYAELDERSLQLRDASEAKSRFLASVSHELRSPINSIMAVARFLLEPDSEPLSSPQSYQVGIIVSSAEELLARVTDLLDLAKAESGKLQPQPDRIDLDRILAQLGASMRPLAADGVALVVDAQDAPVLVETDATLLEQLLRNLISNALKYTEAGEVRVSAESVLSANSLTIRVADTGIGIAPEHHSLIFEEFFQVAGKHQTGHRSTGLGLAYVRRVADALGATIRVDSEVGTGTTFRVTVPLQWLSTPLVSSTSHTEDWDTLHLDTVLVVDDEPGFRQLLRQMLQGVAARVIEADDATDALDLMRQAHPDAVLLDLRMPQGGGEAVLVRATVEDDLRGVPIAVVTSVELETLTTRPLDRAFAVVSKSGLTRESLLAKLQPLAQRRP